MGGRLKGETACCCPSAKTFPADTRKIFGKEVDVDSSAAVARSWREQESDLGGRKMERNLPNIAQMYLALFCQHSSVVQLYFCRRWPCLGRETHVHGARLRVVRDTKPRHEKEMLFKTMDEIRIILFLIRASWSHQSFCFLEKNILSSTCLLFLSRCLIGWRFFGKRHFLGFSYPFHQLDITERYAGA